MAARARGSLERLIKAPGILRSCIERRRESVLFFLLFFNEENPRGGRAMCAYIGVSGTLRGGENPSLACVRFGLVRPNFPSVWCVLDSVAGVLLLLLECLRMQSIY